MSRQLMAVLLLLVAGLPGCSKTQDTAPETRIFGDPPSIGGVTFNADTVFFECDISRMVQSFFCEGGVPRSWYTLGTDNTNTARVRIGYTQFQFLVQVTDPQTTQAQNDILLVSASFTTPQGAGEGQVEETSLLLFDDGSDLHFSWTQTASPVDSCPGTACPCREATYNLTSNDVSESDTIFTRGFGFIAPGGPEGLVIPANAFSIVETCLARDRHQAPFSAPAYIGTDISFTIEATDRAGSITEWPDHPVGRVSPTSWDCSMSDPCACCILGSPDPEFECSGLPGLVSTNPGGWPVGSGFCQNF